MLRFLHGSPRLRPLAPPKGIEPARPDDNPASARTAETSGAPGGRLIKWREFLERLLGADGYIVQGSSEKIADGSSVRMWGTDQAFRIGGPASYDDALRQWRAWQEISGEEMEPPPASSELWFYYKFRPRS